jgi:hypothetical protein
MHTLSVLLLSAFSSLFVGFIWYNPKSATGSKLEMTNNKQTKQ